jgi:putative ABC transport system permease protein
MIFTLALRNLLHDGVRFAGTLIGIGFSIFLVSVQLGLYVGFSRQISAMIDRTSGDLWIIPNGTKSFEEASALDLGERYVTLSIPGVAEVVPFVVGFMEWRKPAGEAATVVIVGIDPVRGLAPWNFVEGSVSDLATPNGVIVDKTYLEELGVSGRGATAQIEGHPVRVAALTQHIRAFTTTPYVFTTLDRARNYVAAGQGEATHLMDVRSAHEGGLLHAQPQSLAVFHGRGLRADRRCDPRPGRRDGDRGADALRKHEGSPRRVRHASRNRLDGRLHPQGHPVSGRDQCGDRL